MNGNIDQNGRPEQPKLDEILRQPTITELYEEVDLMRVGDVVALRANPAQTGEIVFLYRDNDTVRINWANPLPHTSSIQLGIDLRLVNPTREQAAARTLGIKVADTASFWRLVTRFHEWEEKNGIDYSNFAHNLSLVQEGLEYYEQGPQDYPTARRMGKQFVLARGDMEAELTPTKDTERDLLILDLIAEIDTILKKMSIL